MGWELDKCWEGCSFLFQSKYTNHTLDKTKINVVIVAIGHVILFSITVVVVHVSGFEKKLSQKYLKRAHGFVVWLEIWQAEAVAPATSSTPQASTGILRGKILNKHHGEMKKTRGIHEISTIQRIQAKNMYEMILMSCVWDFPVLLGKARNSSRLPRTSSLERGKLSAQYFGQRVAFTWEYSRICG